jgi:hypothetical protein
MEQSWAVFLGGLGVGSAVTAFVQHALARHAKQQDLRMSELKEAFTGFLAAFAKMKENDASRENQANFGLWVARVQLVASPSVSNCIDTVIHSQPNSAARTTAFDAMLLEMRKDIGIGKQR